MPPNRLSSSVEPCVRLDCPLQQQYYLLRHVHVCKVGTDAVFLDLRANRYLGLDANQTIALSSLLYGWSGRSTIEPPSNADVRDLLLKDKLVTDDPSLGRDASGPQLAAAKDQLICWDQMSASHVSPRRLGEVALAATWASALLRLASFEAIVERLRTHRRNALVAFDEDRARELMCAYYHIRPFLFGKRDRCLLDSLTLARFLSGYGLFARWIIGVKTRPFGAHCWIQHGEHVLNGTSEYVLAYTPILVI